MGDSLAFLLVECAEFIILQIISLPSVRCPTTFMKGEATEKFAP
jgi:hypothetical protein